MLSGETCKCCTNEEAVRLHITHCVSLPLLLCFLSRSCTISASNFSSLTESRSYTGNTLGFWFKYDIMKIIPLSLKRSSFQVLGCELQKLKWLLKWYKSWNGYWILEYKEIMYLKGSIWLLFFNTLNLTHKLRKLMVRHR